MFGRVPLKRPSFPYFASNKSSFPFSSSHENFPIFSKHIGDQMKCIGYNDFRGEPARRLCCLIFEDTMNTWNDIVPPSFDEAACYESHHHMSCRPQLEENSLEFPSFWWRIRALNGEKSRFHPKMKLTYAYNHQHRLRTSQAGCF